MKTRFKKLALAAAVLSSLAIAPASSAKVQDTPPAEPSGGFAVLTYCPTEGPICTMCIGTTEWSVCFPVPRQEEQQQTTA